MQKNRLLVLWVILFLTPLVSVAQSTPPLWRFVDPSGISTRGSRQLEPEKYRVAALDRNAIESALSAINSHADATIDISLPNPEGGQLRFQIWEQSVMEPALQARYPDIRTYTGVASHDPRVTAKIDFGPSGFHAMIWQGETTWMIDPYSSVDDGYYLVYYKKDYSRPSRERMVCDFDGAPEDGALPIPGSPEQLPSAGGLPRNELKQNGDTRRTYRLALSCTGEYAVAVSQGVTPTKSIVLSKMVTTMNRVNGVFERELAVTMVLIAQEDDLIYLDPATDPFTANNSGFSLMGENQTNTVSVVGTAAFDIGHIFSTGGGGIASLGSVCQNSRKAKGVTGSSNPVGDPFDIDYVAHEMGHQFGANHSFNSCGQSGNENMWTAFEPGGGTTIMAYAGICGVDDNVQMNSSPYFHSASLTEIHDFVTGNVGWGSGGTCAATTTGITPPDLDPIGAEYYIPAETAFELIGAPLTATGSDSINYCWEEWDLGNFKEQEPNSANFTEGPTFRSRVPVGMPTRVFPVIDSLVVHNYSFKGERLPVVARDLTFRLIARKVQQGWGSFDISDDSVLVHVVATATPFAVTAPSDANLVFDGGASISVTWEKGGTDGGAINCQTVDVFLSRDGGYTYPDTLAVDIPNSGSATVTLPDVLVDEARIKIKGHGNIFFDISDHSFKIDGDIAINELEKNVRLQVFPNPASGFINLETPYTHVLQLRLTDNLGKVVWRGTMRGATRIDVTSLPAGMYYLSVGSAQSGQQFVRKIALR